MRLRPRNAGPSVLVAGSLTVVLALAACSSGSTSSGGGGGGGGGAASSGSSSCAQSAQTKVTAASRPAKFTAPSTPVDVKSLAGKTVFYLAPDLSLPFIKAIADGFSEGAKAAGLKPVIFDGKGNVNTFNQGVNSAVAQKVDGLLLQGINPSLVSGPLAQITASKAPIVDSLNGGPDAPNTDGVQAHVTVDYKLGGQLMADNALAQSNCKGDIVFFTSSIYKVYVDMLAGFRSEISSLCPACKAPTVVDVAPTDLATKLPTLTTTNLTRHPSAKVFVAAYDGMVQFISPSIQEASSKVVIIAHDGVDSNLQQIRAGSTPQISTISNPPNAAIGWAEVDQLVRLMSGAAAVTEDLPQQIFTKTNAAADAASMFPGYADYQSTYKTLWGVS
jgi:ribose transport system substrate-binding protein